VCNYLFFFQFLAVPGRLPLEQWPPALFAFVFQVGSGDFPGLVIKYDPSTSISQVAGITGMRNHRVKLLLN
jgi:hypothetical protein